VVTGSNPVVPTNNFKQMRPSSNYFEGGRIRFCGGQPLKVFPMLIRPDCEKIFTGYHVASGRLAADAGNDDFGGSFLVLPTAV
jgi:hypothetical protein